MIVRKEVIKYMRAIRILKNSIRDSFKSVFRNFSLSMASILCTTITLIWVAVSLFLSYNVRQVTKNLERELTIVAYFKSDVKEEQEQKIQNDLKTVPEVESFELKTKNEWKAEMMNENDTLKATLAYLEENPLLDSLIVKVKDVTRL